MRCGVCGSCIRHKDEGYCRRLRCKAETLKHWHRKASPARRIVGWVSKALGTSRTRHVYRVFGRQLSFSDERNTAISTGHSRRLHVSQTARGSKPVSISAARRAACSCGSVGRELPEAWQQGSSPPSACCGPDPVLSAPHRPDSEPERCSPALLRWFAYVKALRSVCEQRGSAMPGPELEILRAIE